MLCAKSILLAALSIATAVAQSTVTVRSASRNVTYVGSSFSGVENFEGIRYGQNTSGPNRFRHPLPYTYPNGSTVQATTAGPACPQNTVQSFLGIFSQNPGVFNMSEDCLNLRIARPEGTRQNASLPVMVWIYGNGDEAGSSNYTLYDPTALVLGAAARGTPVVFVAMNFRVNVFGFANSPALRSEQSLNSGLLDQRLALQWVQQNIVTFGGNASEVTIFGESDGGTSVGLHLTAYGGNGSAPFRRAIMQSGGPSGDPGVTGNFTVNSTSTVAELAGCNGTNTSQVLTCLRQLPMPQLLNAVLEYENLTTAQGVSQDIFFPTVDGSFLPAAPSTLIRNGSFHKNISVITGWNFNDGSIFTPPTLNGSDGVQAFLQSGYPTLNATTLRTLISLYPVADFFATAQNVTISPYFLQAAQIYRDVNFACQSIDVAQRVAQYGSRSFIYDLNQTSLASGLALFGASFEGVLHISDIPYVFNQPNLGFGATAADNLTATRMSGSWVQFAATGNPTSANSTTTLPGWNQAFALNNTSTSTGRNQTTVQPPQTVNLRVIGGPNAGQYELSANATTNATSGGARIEPRLLERCAFINSPSFYEQLQT